MKTQTLTRALTVLALVSPAVAADNLPKEVQNMDCLIGTWKGTGTLSMGKDKAKLSATYTCKSTSGNFGLICQLDMTGIPGLAHYRETDLFGYEPNSKTYHWFAVTNGGETHDHVAPYTESNKVRFIYNGVQEGKPFKEVLDWEFGGMKKPTDKPTSIKVRGETFAGKQSTSVLEMAMTKR